MEYSIDDLIERYPVLNSCKGDILKACDMLIECFKSGHKLLICGNGGSCSDANHICGELMKSFVKPRPINNQLKTKIINIDPIAGRELSNALQSGFPCIALDNHQSLNTAFINDVDKGSLFAFSQQVNVYGNAGDVLWCISTSGNSKNVYNAAIVARARDMKIFSMTGAKESKLSSISDITIRPNEEETFKIQELHLPIYHYLCLKIEDSFFSLINNIE